MGVMAETAGVSLGGITSKSSRGREPKTVLGKRHLAWVLGEKQPAGNFGESCTV